MKYVIFVLWLCGAVALAQENKAAVDPGWVVPEKAAQQVNPLKDKPEAVAGGKKIFTRNCAQCHGDEKHERTNNAPDLGRADVQEQTDGALFWRISSGNSRRGMPSFSSLPEGIRWQLVLYIRTVGGAKP